MTARTMADAVADLDRWRAYHQGDRPPSMVRAADGPWLLRSEVLAALAAHDDEGLADEDVTR